MHCVGGHTLVSVLIVAVLITLFLSKTFPLLDRISHSVVHKYTRLSNEMVC